MKPDTPKPRAPGTERVTLRLALTHAGVPYPAGAQLAVDAPTAAWLRRVEAVTEAPEPPEPPEKAGQSTTHPRNRTAQPMQQE